MRIGTIAGLLLVGGLSNTAFTEPSDAVRVRYMVNNIDEAVTFYTQNLGFEVRQGPTKNFVILSRGNLQLVLSTPFGPGGAAKPMANGERAKPGGWNRIIINVSDLPAEVARLRDAGLHFRSDILKGPGGAEVLVDDPSRNPIELFQPSSAPSARAK